MTKIIAVTVYLPEGEKVRFETEEFYPRDHPDMIVVDAAEITATPGWVRIVLTPNDSKKGADEIVYDGFPFIFAKKIVEIDETA